MPTKHWRLENHATSRAIQKAAQAAIRAKLGFIPGNCETVNPLGQVVGYCPLYSECRELVARYQEVRCCLSDSEVEGLVQAQRKAA